MCGCAEGPSAACARAAPGHRCCAHRLRCRVRRVGAARSPRLPSRRAAGRRPSRARRIRPGRSRCRARGWSPSLRGGRAAARRRARQPQAAPARPRRRGFAAVRGIAPRPGRRTPAGAPPRPVQRVAGDTGVPRVPGRPLQRDARNVERSHIPAVDGEPDGVRALAAADIEAPPGCEPGDLGHERTVRLAAPHLLSLGVPPIPLRPHLGRSGVSIGGRGDVGRGRSCSGVIGHRPILAHGVPGQPFRCRSRRLAVSGQGSVPRANAGCRSGYAPRHFGVVLGSDRVGLELLRDCAHPGERRPVRGAVVNRSACQGQPPSRAVMASALLDQSAAITDRQMSSRCTSSSSAVTLSVKPNSIRAEARPNPTVTPHASSP
jgi:hypothetical protein